MFVVTVGLYGTEGLALTGRTARKKTSIKKHPEPQAAAHREGMHGITGVHHARAESRARGIRPALNMLVQVMTGHGCFGHYLYRVARREPTPLCYECGAADDTAQHTLEGCSKRGPQRRTLVAAIGGDLSLPSVVLAMLSSESASLAVPDFCEDVISQKEAAERVREEAPDAHPLRRRRVGRRRRQFEASQLLLPSQASLASYRRFTSFSTI
ncbi:jg14797 [Pararge aegeria aegeria]|uniref:Jg14797 protein n=2 Tax=Pararge aegeria TaxID=116150 RepID=A0A8S4QNL8_9NEOP|nr:jg14797 [Pararge aegeria aegeria]